MDSPVFIASPAGERTSLLLLLPLGALQATGGTRRLGMPLLAFAQATCIGK